ANSVFFIRGIESISQSYNSSIAIHYFSAALIVSETHRQNSDENLISKGTMGIIRHVSKYVVLVRVSYYL
ncbi:TPA: hypothetical protein ACJIKS_000959, partial [Klebsiella quasipneumoniae]